jgi:hypothetical protein
MQRRDLESERITFTLGYLHCPYTAKIRGIWFSPPLCYLRMLKQRKKQLPVSTRLTCVQT